MDVLRQVRAWSSVPVLVLSARDQQDEKVQALDLGADDYLTKPFGVPELLARVRAVLRRLDRAATDDAPRVIVDDLTIDLPNRRVEKDGEPVHLTLTEWRVLHELVVARPKTVPHRLLLERVWGPAYGDEAHYVRVVDPTTRARSSSRIRSIPGCYSARSASATDSRADRPGPIESGAPRPRPVLSMGGNGPGSDAAGPAAPTAHAVTWPDTVGTRGLHAIFTAVARRFTRQ